MVLMGTFAGSRLVWGTWLTGQIYWDIYQAVMGTPGGATKIEGMDGWQQGQAAERERVMSFAGPAELPIWLWGSYLVANTVLGCLNFYWFSLMVRTAMAAKGKNTSKALEGNGAVPCLEEVKAGKTE
jgi:hypothetical protein